MEWLDTVADHIDEIGMLVSVWDPEYEGSLYCKGLISAYEAKAVGASTVMEVVKAKVFHH